MILPPRTAAAIATPIPPPPHAIAEDDVVVLIIRLRAEGARRPVDESHRCGPDCDTVIPASA